MKRPWNKRPRRTAAGEPRYIIGFRDHNGVERSRSFTATRGRDRWVTRYEEAERQNRLGEFFEGADPSPHEVSIEGLLVSWFAHDADPALPGGLAEATFHSFRSIASRHILGVIRQERQARGTRAICGRSHAVQSCMDWAGILELLGRHRTGVGD